MTDFVKYAIGDIVQLKKAHPCGSFEWEVVRTVSILLLFVAVAVIASWYRDLNSKNP